MTPRASDGRKPNDGEAFCAELMTPYGSRFVRPGDGTVMRVHPWMAGLSIQFGLHGSIREVLQLMGLEMHLSGTGSQFVAQIALPQTV
jgi:hypothetical protein